MIMDIDKIAQYLPHRYPMLLVDRVVECSAETLIAIKNVSINEPFFAGHFPERPVMPGVLVLESIAQACGLLAFSTGARELVGSHLIYLVGIDDARFKRQVVPGDQLRLEVTHKRTVRGLWIFTGRATVDGALAAEAEIRCTMREIE